jgi:hypothetical protein
LVKKARMFILVAAPAMVQTKPEVAGAVSALTTNANGVASVGRVKLAYHFAKAPAVVSTENGAEAPVPLAVVSTVNDCLLLENVPAYPALVSGAGVSR